MKNIIFVMLIIITAASSLFAQPDPNLVSEQIKNKRDSVLDSLATKLRDNELTIRRIQNELSSLQNASTSQKLNRVEALQNALENRMNILEAAPKKRTSLNGQLAFTELLSIQRDIQPATLFLASKEFFSQLGSVNQLHGYKDFTNWKVEYDKWHQDQNKNDQMLALLNSSVKLISDAANNLPMYGPIVQTVSTGITTIVANKKNKELVKTTPAMLSLLNSISQFEQQKASIDHEWQLINKELDQLQKENISLVKEQLDYYGLSEADYKARYVNQFLDTQRDTYKSSCLRIIATKHAALDASPESSKLWLGQVETYMYKVQSLRMRFGQLTSRMLSNLERYEQLIELYSDNTKFHPEFVKNLKDLNNSLSLVRKTFSTSFNPAKYIEDSSIMYIGRTADHHESSASSGL